jgi:hypothetical protein
MKPIQTICALFFSLFTSLAHAGMVDFMVGDRTSEKFAREFIEKIQLNDFAYTSQRTEIENQAAFTPEIVQQMANTFPKGKRLTQELIGFQTKTIANDGITHDMYTYEYQFEGGWLLASIVVKNKDNQLMVSSVYVLPTEKSQKELNQFQFAGKTALHYALLAFMVLIPLFILISLIFCLRTPNLNRRWLWLICIAFGFGNIQLNWNSGALDFFPITFQLFGAGFYSFDNGPTIIQISIPIAALLFWIKRSNQLERNKRNELSGTSQATL